MAGGGPPEDFIANSPRPLRPFTLAAQGKGAKVSRHRLLGADKASGFRRESVSSVTHGAPRQE